MPNLEALALSEVAFSRLQALANARSSTPSELAVHILAESLSSNQSRREIRKHRRGQSLTDLGWIDGYDGQTVDDILAFSDSEHPERVLDTLEQAIEGHWKTNPGKRTGVENIIVAVMALLREVNNGGFDQFYRNSSKKWAFFAHSALLHIDRKDAARIVARSRRALGTFEGAVIFAGVGKRFEELDEKMSRKDARRDRIFEQCNIAFYELKGLPESLLAYVHKHQTGIIR